MESSAIAVAGVDGLIGLVGSELPPTRWIELGRDAHRRYDAAAHYSPTRFYSGAEASPIVHGAHTLGLAVSLFEQMVDVDGFAGAALYGFDRVRFTHPVPVGSRVRVHFHVAAVDDAGGDAVICRVGVTVELEDAAKPAGVADLLLRYAR